MGIDRETWRHRDKKRDKGTQRQRDGVRQIKKRYGERHRDKKEMEREKRLKDRDIETKRWRDTGTIIKTGTEGEDDETETLQKETPRAVAGNGMGA